MKKRKDNDRHAILKAVGERDILGKNEKERMKERFEKTRQERNYRIDLFREYRHKHTVQHSTGLCLPVNVRKCCYIQPTVAYHPPSHRPHECSQRLENSDIDESPPMTFLMWFLNKWDFSISLLLVSIKGSLSTLFCWMKTFVLCRMREL